MFTALRWLGGGYLIYLGVKLWRAPFGAAGLEAAPAASPLRMLAHAYAVTALNPKGIIFFVAFVPQFLDDSRPFLPQMAVLVGTFVTMATINSLCFAFLASAAVEAALHAASRQQDRRLVADRSRCVGVQLAACRWITRD
jgi:threonine/homoserine/homoserine lactone efflux protein